MISTYADFLQSKRRVWKGVGLTSATIPSQLYLWQAAITRWALRKGRAAIFADCGLGKTYMQLAWAQALDGRVLLFAPLCVAEQTIEQAATLGIALTYVHDQTEADRAESRLVITNYERLERFDPSMFHGVVLDESSILKSFDGKTRTALIAAFHDTPYRLCCTATPAPNDIAELANHAEFLGLMTRPEFLATWFVHDDEGWRMKGHAVKPFYRWMASWALALRAPSDLGYDDTGYMLPPLNIRHRTIETDAPVGVLFPGINLSGIRGRLEARRGSLDQRVEETAKLCAADGQWICWCGLNSESTELARRIPDAVEVTGNDTYSEKVGAVNAFTHGKIRVLVTKPKILGFGMNFQHCHQMAFVGLSDSYETYYQCLRRCWRFGQRHPVDAWIVVSDTEGVIVDNVRKKEAEADRMAADLLSHMTDAEREELNTCASLTA